MMRHTLVFDEDLPCFRIALKGDFDPGEWERCYREVLSHPQWQPGASILWDARQCLLDKMSLEQVRAIGEITVRLKDRRGVGKSAWVVDSDVDYGMSRMFELSHERNLNFRFHIFRSLEEAKTWIGGNAPQTNGES